MGLRTNLKHAGPMKAKPNKAEGWDEKLKINNEVQIKNQNKVSEKESCAGWGDSSPAAPKASGAWRAPVERE